MLTTVLAMPMSKQVERQPLPVCSLVGVNEAGCDEAGRGCLAGSVFAAAVILPDNYSNSLLNDSKQLTEKQRDFLRRHIEAEAVAWCVGVVTAGEIDKINILRASILAMHRALDGLSVRPGAIAVDGNCFTPYGSVPYNTYVKGDGRFANIAAASILAMRRIHELYPQYGWDVNKGYPTKAHRAAIARYGITPYHRQTFRLLPPEQLTLF